MPKVHFFKLAQELGERPVELQKKLAAGGITVQSTSSMLDESMATQVREFLRSEAAQSVSLAPAESLETAAPVAAPPAVEAPPPVIAPPVAPIEAPAAPVAPVAPAEPRPITRIMKRPPGSEGQAPRPAGAPVAGATPRVEGKPGGKPGTPDAQAPKGRKVRSNLLITPETDGGLSPEAEFGIVKAAGIVPLPTAPERPVHRPPQREDQRPPFSNAEPRPPRPGGEGPARPGEAPRGRGPGGPPQAPGAEAPGAANGAPRGPADAKKKQKRTIFSDQDKEKGRLQTRTGDLAATSIRRRKRRSTGPKRERVGEQFVVEEPVIITGPVTVRELAERVNVTHAQVISQLIGMGILATVNQMIEPEQAVTLLEKLEFEAVYERELIEQASWRLTAGAEAASGGELRPPVVTILGHVDHGKTTLLDSIRHTSVTAQEFGGITQHIGAYQVEINGKKISFLDTPGHAAFTAMRARGANLTDIAVLVVAADDGIQPQTIEAIDHAKAAKVPIIVAVNKVDLPDAQPEVVKQQLTSYGLVAEEWGGDTVIVPVSAKKGTGIEHLLEMILLVAEVQDLHAEADKPARGAVVESKLDKQRGPVTTVLVQEGTLRVGDALVVGMVAGKVRAMTDYTGQAMKEAGPSMPVEITGLATVPVAGDLFEVLGDEREARVVAEQRQLKAREERLQTHVSLQNLSNLVAAGAVKDLNIIIKTDVAGSIEAISQALGQVESSEIRVNIIHGGVGDITESDVLLASASQAIILGFHVHIEAQGRMIAEEAGIDVRIYQIIYDLVDDVRKAMVGMLTPILEEVVLGHAEVRAVFRITRVGVIAGSYVTDGQVRRGTKVRVKRAGEVIATGNLDSLKHLKDDVREMNQGFECGIGLDNFSAWQEGDIIESYQIKELRRETL